MNWWEHLDSCSYGSCVDSLFPRAALHSYWRLSQKIQVGPGLQEKKDVDAHKRYQGGREASIRLAWPLALRCWVQVPDNTLAVEVAALRSPKQVRWRANAKQKSPILTWWWLKMSFLGQPRRLKQELFGAVLATITCLGCVDKCCCVETAVVFHIRSGLRCL